MQLERLGQHRQSETARTYRPRGKHNDSSRQRRQRSGRRGGCPPDGRHFAFGDASDQRRHQIGFRGEVPVYGASRDTGSRCDRHDLHRIHPGFGRELARGRNDRGVTDSQPVQDPFGAAVGH
jgi:hypothetical protein